MSETDVQNWCFLSFYFILPLYLGVELSLVGLDHNNLSLFPRSCNFCLFAWVWGCPYAFKIPLIKGTKVKAIHVDKKHIHLFLSSGIRFKKELFRSLQLSASPRNILDKLVPCNNSYESITLEINIFFQSL